VTAWLKVSIAKEIDRCPWPPSKASTFEIAAGMDDLDYAAKHLQDLAGITTGDVASHFLNEKGGMARWLALGFGILFLIIFVLIGIAVRE
jgi:hypothetical protein